MRQAFLAMLDSAWTPRSLGSKLIAWWAPPGASNTTQSGGLISSWRDEVAAYDFVQATSASQPAYSASGLGGRACAEFDGVNDHLTLAPVPAAWPTGAAGGEMWASCRQDALVADATVRALFTYGADAGANQRQIDRNVSSGVNRGIATSDATISTNISVDFSGAHVLRGVSTSTTIQAVVDGVAGPAVAITPSTTSTRARLGASTANTPSFFWKGAVREVLVTEPLTTDEAAALLAYLT